MKVPLTPTRFLDRSRRLFADKTAIVCGDTRLSYAEYGERVDRLAHALRELGVGQGDRVAYLGMNCHRLLELYYAILPVGAILAPLNVRLNPQELVFILNDLEASVLFTDGVMKRLAEALVPNVPSLRHVVYTTGPERPEGWHDYEALLAAAPGGAPDPAPVDEDDVAEIFYTSGTTGRPKGVMLTHRNLYLHALQTIITLGSDDRTVQIVGTVPLFHVNGWGAPQCIVGVGGTQVVTPRFDPADFCRLVQNERASLGMMVPSMLNDLVNFAGADDYDLSSLERIMIGGAPPPYTLLRAAANRFHCEVQVGYGLSETTPVVTLATIKAHQADTISEEERYRRLSLTGLPVIGVEIRVVGADGRDVPPDGTTVGEIIIRGDLVTKGYWRRPEETAAAIRDGWFYTGDMATVDAEGYLQIVDRKKDVIISGGENISSVEIEDALYSHPAVRECAVVGIPDDRWGEVPFAFVVLKEGWTAAGDDAAAGGGAGGDGGGASAGAPGGAGAQGDAGGGAAGAGNGAAAGAAGSRVSAEDLAEHVRGRLARFKVPKGFRFVDSLPKTGTGKVQKAELREPFWEGRERRVN